MKEKFKLYICETKMEINIVSNVINLKDRIVVILNTTAENKAVTAACFSEKGEKPMVMIHKTASGEFTYYLPEQI